MLRSVFVMLVMLLASVAKADVFVIAPPYYEGTDGQALSDELVRLVTEDLERQHEIVGPKKAAALVPKEHRVSCPEGECAERYRAAAGAVAAIVVRVGRAGVGPGPATSFQLGIQPAPGVEYTQGALLSDGPLKDIAVRALREAFRDYRDPGPWLTVSGAPGGASVYVDDRAVGILPWTDRLPLGTRRVRVEARGFEPMTKIVGLMSPTERKKLEFRLEPARVGAVVPAEAGHEGRPAVPARPDDARKARRALFGGVALTSLGAVAFGAWAVSRGAADWDEQLRPGWKIGTGVVGALSATAGVALLACSWKLHNGGREKAGLGIGPMNVQVRGSF